MVEEAPSGKATLLPVKVSTPTLTPSERAKSRMASVPARESSTSSMEFAGRVQTDGQSPLPRPYAYVGAATSQTAVTARRR
jgi:hypothetical protein